jgi:hypothetical protein
MLTPLPAVNVVAWLALGSLLDHNISPPSAPVIVTDVSESPSPVKEELLVMLRDPLLVPSDVESSWSQFKSLLFTSVSPPLPAKFASIVGFALLIAA